ncbi:MAG: hypothetical protein ACK5N8_07085 [Alphaproteobacteria bacterium]
MKTNLIFIFALGALLFSCSSSKTLSQKEKLDLFAKGEATFFETFDFWDANIIDPKPITGIVVKAEITYDNRYKHEYLKNRYPIGCLITLDNGKKLTITDNPSKGLKYRQILDWVSSDGKHGYIEAYLTGKDSSNVFVLIDKPYYDRAIDFYKNGERRKDFGTSTINQDSLMDNRYFGKIEKNVKNRIYEVVWFYCGNKSVDLVYVENGDVLCTSSALRQYMMKQDYPETRQIVNYVMSDMTGLCKFSNIYKYEIEKQE